MKTAIIYARYSSNSQTEQSIEGQLHVCEEYAKRHDIIILDTYIDRAMTGTNDMRPDFQRMLKDSAKREWDYVLVYKLDRFSRNKYEATVHKKTLKDNGVKVISAMENIPDSPEGIILESLLEGMNQYYSAELSQKVKRGMHETRLKGNYQGGTLPYGYVARDKKVVIDEERAEVVRYIFEQYASGVYVSTIIATLTEKGIRYNGKPFVPNTVYGILKNEKYSGSYTLRDEVVDKIYPPIVPQELFAKVRAKVNANHHGKRSIAVVYLLRNKMKCGCCGESIIAECGTSKMGDRRYYYKCHGRKNLRNGCHQRAFRKEVLEEFVLSHILEELNKPKQIDAIVKGLMKAQEEALEVSSLLTMLEKEQRQNMTAIENIMSAVERGFHSTAANKRMGELEKRQEELERLIIIERSRMQTKVTASEIRAFYEPMLRLEPQLLITHLVKEIIVCEDEIHIYFNSPIETSPDECRGFSLCDTLTFIPLHIQNSDEMRKKAVRLTITI
ncbi:MAG: recombinase family protein [Clostridia bacterium]|nr:recombinase family protein [Clostridia bacterium]